MESIHSPKWKADMKGFETLTLKHPDEKLTIELWITEPMMDSLGDTVFHIGYKILEDELVVSGDIISTCSTSKEQAKQQFRLGGEYRDGA